MWREIKKIIETHNTFLITTHVNPDADGIGAASALIELLLTLRKNVLFVTDSQIPSKFSFLDHHHLFRLYEKGDPQFNKTEVLILLDTHKKERIGKTATLLENSNIIPVCIDHHEASSLFTPFAEIHPSACSVGAMIYSLFKEFKIELNHYAAEGIYTSILFDTGKFCHSTTGIKAHKIANECIKCGVDPDLMHAKIFQHVSPFQIKLLTKTLESMERFFNNHVIIEKISYLDWIDNWGEQEDLEHLDLEYLHEFNKNIENVSCAIVLRELPNNLVRVSFRCYTDLDLRTIVESLGGGGHSKAVGTYVKGSAEEVKEKILPLLSPLFATSLRT